MKKINQVDRLRMVKQSIRVGIAIAGDEATRKSISPAERRDNMQAVEAGLRALRIIEKMGVMD